MLKGLSSRFNSPNKTLIIAEETAAPKPSPIPYLVGMQTLSDALQSRGEPALKPEECVVFEGLFVLCDHSNHPMIDFRR
jgi:beta-phosphoglucomutase-like phosphatase (HAD superfamily)